MKAKLTRAAGAAQDGGSGSPDEILSRIVAQGRVVCATPARPVGVAMRIAEEEGAGAPAFELAIVDETGAIGCVLGRFAEEDIVAEWRRLGLASGLPLMLQNPDGSLSAPYPQIGPLALGCVHFRRGHGLLSGRRPRFLTRRKTGRPCARPLVYREREIVSGRA